MGRAESRPRERQSRRLSFGLRRAAAAASPGFLSRPTRAAARVAALLLALSLAATLGAAGAAAQTEIWSATLTPEVSSSIGGAHGYTDSHNQGALDDVDFDYGYPAVTYTVTSLRYGSNTAYFSVNPHNFTNAQTADLTLKVSSSGGEWSDTLSDRDFLGGSTFVFQYPAAASIFPNNSNWTVSLASANTAPTSANNTVTVEGSSYTFSASDFTFEDSDSGNTLAGVQIVTLPAAGTLELDGSALSAGDNVTRDQLDDRSLTFTPASGDSGEGYASFTFKVSDGIGLSAAADTMTIDVPSATLPPSVTVSPTTLALTEALDNINPGAGSIGTYTVVLGAAPTGDVTVAIGQTLADAALVLDKTSLTFTPDNWDDDADRHGHRV